MAKQVRRIEQKAIVYCSECRFAIRDTEGISFNVDTGEYFMCRCKKNHHITKYGTSAKLFINKPRTCEDYRK